MISSDSNDILASEDTDIYSVSEINEALKQNLESEFPSVRIIGEIANFKAHSSGHFYLTLRDESSLIRLVIFKRNVDRLSFFPENGTQVIASGRISHYGGTGQTQLVADGLVEAGRGAAELEFRRRLQRFIDEGATDPEKKRPIPGYPEKIAVITSLTGAVIRDISETLARRWPLAEILHVPADVQGVKASESIVKAFEITDNTDGLDCVILARGGGSIEDLWAFNLEKTARAVSESRYPVITGIGHEIDTTICDYVSDLRAPTPTAAAELSAPDRILVSGEISAVIENLSRLAGRDSLRRYNMLNLMITSSVFPAIRHKLEYGMLQVDEKSIRLKQSWTGYNLELTQTAGALRSRLDAVVKTGIFEARGRLSLWSERISAADPKKKMSTSLEILKRLKGSIDGKVRNRLEILEERVSLRAKMLEGLHPLSILKRGYSYCTSEDGVRVIAKTADISKDDSIVVNFHDGSAVCSVKDKRKGRRWQ
ncbi:MAG: exodeoxyribonuclease VII large subunit [Candidatus Krumholzibacteriota bacterium]|nr:exodeoxyribonuclease VII large subunit [Candidatus Krumholzibacteriota bacterium]